MGNIKGFLKEKGLTDEQVEFLESVLNRVYETNGDGGVSGADVAVNKALDIALQDDLDS